MIIRTSKELHKIYDYCNQFYFNNALPRVPIKRRRLHKGRLAHTRVNFLGPYAIIMRPGYRSAAELLTTLLHEMIHVENWKFTYSTWTECKTLAKASGWSRGKTADAYYKRLHNKAFKARAQEIERQLGITGIE